MEREPSEFSYTMSIEPAILSDRPAKQETSIRTDEDTAEPVDFQGQRRAQLGPGGNGNPPGAYSQQDSAVSIGGLLARTLML